MDPTSGRPTIDTWDSIAKYLGRSVRTVQDCEHEEGLKINRYRKRVWAYVDDLDEFKRKCGNPPPQNCEIEPVAKTESRTQSVNGSAPGLSAEFQSQPPENPSTTLDRSDDIAADGTLPGFEERNESHTSEQITKPPPFYPRNRWINYKTATVALTLVILSSLLAWTVPHSWPGVLESRQPSRIRVQADTIFVLDEKGRELWTYTFPEPLGNYPTDEVTLRLLYLTADLDGNGRKDVLFVYIPPPREANRGHQLVLFKGGKRIRSVRPGRTLVYGPDHNASGLYTKPYGLAGLVLIPGKPHPKIAITSLHHEDAACQVLILDGQLNIVGEYWHPGHLSFMVVGDIDEDGRVELILGGVNNRHHSATLVALDPDNVSGTTRAINDPRVPDTKHFALYEYGEDEDHVVPIPQGSEKYVVLFPRSYLEFDDKRSLHPYNRVQFINSSEGIFTVAVAEEENQSSSVRILYDLDWRLNVVSAKPSREFQDLQWDRFQKKTIDHPYSKKDTQLLEKNVVVVRYPR